MATKKIQQRPRHQCLTHKGGIKELSETNFYVAKDNGSIFSQTGKILICRDCIANIYQKYYASCKNTKLATYYTCRKIDIAFLNGCYEAAMRDSKGEYLKVFGWYMKNFSSLGSTNGWEGSFDDSEACDLSSDEISEVEITGLVAKMNNTDKKAKKNIENMLGYDPFEGYPETDQKFLYSDFVNYLDEETIEDQYKVSQIIQICNNNNQINKYNFLIAQYSADPKLTLEHKDEIKSFNSLIKDIVANNDKIAKENGVSAKNKTSNSLNKTSLTGKMKFLAQNKFDDIEIDFYDQNKSRGMQFAANISMNAIKEQMQFDENDINEIINTQRDMIKTFQAKIIDLEEENRILNIKVSGETEETYV